jgi:hypothetical protein
MLFRLSNGSIIELNEADVALSEFFEVIHEGVTPIDLVEDFLKKSTFKKVKDILIKELSSTNIKDIQEENKRKVIFERLKEISDSQSESEQLCAAMMKIVENFDSIFHTVIHRIKFIPDDTLKLVIEFLSIQCTQRSNSMLDDLPFLMQGCPAETSISTLVVKNLQPYVEFIEKISGKDLMALSRAACLLGVNPLITLVGCKIAKSISNSTEHQLRSKFKIPEKFRDSVLERINKIPITEEWTNFV